VGVLVTPSPPFGGATFRIVTRRIVRTIFGTRARYVTDRRTFLVFLPGEGGTTKYAVKGDIFTSSVPKRRIGTHNESESNDYIRTPYANYGRQSDVRRQINSIRGTYVSHSAVPSTILERERPEKNSPDRLRISSV